MELYMIAGPNGVGKNHIRAEVPPKYANCKNFVNADLIAQGMSPFSPEAAAIRAGRLVLSEIDFFSQKQVSFGFETTLSGRSYLNLVQRLKKKGYRIYLFFLFVEAVDVTLARIRERVLKGGHDVPEDVVRRRFDRSVRNLFREYQQLVDAWYLFDNTGTEPVPIAFKKGRRVRIMKPETYEMLISRYGER